MPNEPRSILSPRCQKLLESICEKYDSKEAAQNETEFVLELLLKKLDAIQRDSIDLTKSTLSETLSPGALRYYREKYAKQAA